MPVTIAVPSAGCVPDDPSRSAIMYVASEAPAPIAYASASLGTLASFQLSGDAAFDRPPR